MDVLKEWMQWRAGDVNGLYQEYEYCTHLMVDAVSFVFEEDGSANLGSKSDKGDKRARGQEGKEAKYRARGGRPHVGNQADGCKCKLPMTRWMIRGGRGSGQRRRARGTYLGRGGAERERQGEEAKGMRLSVMRW